MSLHVATDRFMPHAGLELTSGAPRRRPAGLRHALRLGRRQALCGAEPALVWTAVAWPGDALDTDQDAELCVTCDERARHVLQGYAEVIPFRARELPDAAAGVG